MHIPPWLCFRGGDGAAVKLARSLWFAYSLIVVGVSGAVGIGLLVWGVSVEMTTMFWIGAALLAVSLAGLLALFLVLTWLLVSGGVRVLLGLVEGRRTAD